MSDARAAFKVMAVVQALGALGVLPMANVSTGAIVIGNLMLVVGTLGTLGAASGWAALGRSPLAWAVAAALAVGALMPLSLASMVVRMSGALLFVVSNARVVPTLHVGVGAAAAGFALVAELARLDALVTVAFVFYNLGCAFFIVGLPVRELPPVVWPSTTRGAKLAFVGESIRMWAGVVTLVTVLLALVVRHFADMVVGALILVNLATMTLVAVGAGLLARGRGAGVIWFGAALGLVVVAFVAGAIDWLASIEGMGYVRVVAQPGALACLALGLGAVLDATSPTRHRGEAKRAAATYLTLVAIGVVDVFLASFGWLPFSLLFSLAALIVLVIAVSALNRLTAEVELAARDARKTVDA